MLHLHTKKALLLLDNGPTTQQPISTSELNQTFVDLTLHKINNRVVLEELLQQAELRASMKQHVLGSLNDSLACKAKIDRSLDLLTKSDDVLRSIATSMSNIHQKLPYHVVEKKLHFAIEKKNLLQDKLTLSSMFDKGMSQLIQKTPYHKLDGVNELTDTFARYMVKFIPNCLEVLSIYLSHISVAEFIGCLTFQPHLVSMVGSLLFFKFAIPLFAEGNFIALLNSCKKYIIDLGYKKPSSIVFSPSVKEMEKAKLTLDALFGRLNPEMTVKGNVSKDFSTSKNFELTLRNTPWFQKLLLGGISGGMGIMVVGALYPYGISLLTKTLASIFPGEILSSPRKIGADIRFHFLELMKGLLKL